MKRCIIVKPEWRIIEGWAPAYAQAFQMLGYAVDLAENVGDLFKIISSAISSDINSSFEFLLTFSGYGINEAAMGQFSFDILGIPVVSLYIDHPENTPSRHNLSPVNSFSGLFDRGDIIYARKYLESSTRYFFLTDAGLEYPGPLPGFYERDIDILFCGTIPDYNKNRACIEGMGRPNLLKFFDMLAYMLLHNEHLSPYDALEAILENSGFRLLPGGAGSTLIHVMISQVTHYVRGKRRIKLLNTLLDSGLKICCVGPPGHFHMFDNPNLQILDYAVHNAFGDGYLQLVRRAKVTINTSPLSQYAISERQPTSMLNGALVVSDMNPYMDLYFKDGRDLIAYSHEDYGHLPQSISFVLGNREKWEEMTYNAYNIAKTHHTFTCRAKEIIDVLHSGF